MLAGDLGIDSHLPGEAWDDGTGTWGQPSSGLPESGAEGEGTEAPDLVAFAQALTASGVKFYSAVWCPGCNTQKALFEDGGDFLPYIEVTNPDRTLNAIGIAANITSFPTWEFPDGSRETGVLSLATIADRAGVAIPTSADPFIAPIADRTVYGGSPLHIGLNGYDPNGGPLTYTVTSSNPTLVSGTILTGNRSARITVSGWGDMVFQLFESQVPNATGRFITLAESGFYDAANNDPPITVHRVVDNFVLQFGDPTGTGGGGSSLGPFDDDFHPDLQHNTAGALSWAKAGDDTNNSQVFVTDVPIRYLDFNHSYFGQLTEGESVRNGITATATNSSDKPIVPINIESVTIFEDHENGMLVLKAAEDASGDADITVTVTDADGNQYVETFHVTVSPDPYNSGPYLEDIPAIATTVNTPATFTISAIDVEGDPVLFSGVKAGNVNYTFSVDSQTGQVTVTPPTDYVGTMQILLRVAAANGSDTTDPYDSQLVSITVAPAAPAAVDLVAASDSGFSSTDNITNQTSLAFEVTGVTSGAQVRLYHGMTSIGEATASGTSVTITTSSLSDLADGTYTLYATQTVSDLESDASAPLSITLDRTAPAAFTSTPPTTATVGVPMIYDAQHPEEGSVGTVYSLSAAPAGISIDPATGVLTWTPTAAQAGVQTFAIVISDVAGNTRTQDLSLTVAADALMQFRLEVTDTSGTPISSINVGEDFQLNVYVQDLRAVPYGVFAAFLDVVYSSQYVAVNGSLTYGSEYSTQPLGSVATPGLIDEAGAVAGLTELNGGEYLLWSLPMTATHAGTALFTADPSDILPSNEVLLFRDEAGLASEHISYGSTLLTVQPGFVANDDTFSVDEDSPGTVLDVLANDQVVSGSPGNLTITAVGTTSHGGSVTIAQDGKSVTYTPAPDFFGDETFSYTVSDGTGDRTAQVVVQVTAVNDDPTAVDDTFTVTENAVGVTLDVLANDLIAPDIDETLIVVSFSNVSAGGTLSIPAAKDCLLYTPAANFSGVETFTYTISDGHGGTATATVSVTVTEAYDPPLAQDDLFEVMEDSTDNTLDVLNNDSAQGDTTETLTIIATTTPDRGGTVTIAPDGKSLIYTPAADFFGIERLQYTISDGNGGTAQATAVITVTAVNDPPTAGNDAVTVSKNSTANTLDVLANDSSDPDGPETLTITAVGTTSAGGTVSIANGGTSLTYTPAAGYVGIETFTYTIQDPDGATASATVTVTVTEYIPSKLSGYVYIDVNNNGVKEAAELPLGGVVITLSGTSVTGASVNVQATTDATGLYQFTNLAPGTYKLTQAQPAFLIDGIDSGGTLATSTGADELTINLAENVDGQNLNFGERGRKPQYISVFDFFASTPRNTVLATAASTNSAQWYAIEGGWSHAQTLQVELQSNQTAARLNVTTTDAAHCSTLLDLQSPQVVQHLGNNGTAQLVRIVASPATLFPTADCACAEGEAPRDDGAEGESAGDTTPKRLAAATPADGYRATDLLLAQAPPADQWGIVPLLDDLRDDDESHPARVDEVLASLPADLLLP